MGYHSWAEMVYLVVLSRVSPYGLLKRKNLHFTVRAYSRVGVNFNFYFQRGSLFEAVYRREGNLRIYIFLTDFPLVLYF